jgi:hypothetical protein
MHTSPLAWQPPDQKIFTRPTDKMAMSIREFKDYSGLGVTSIYDLLNKGLLKSVTIGRKRLIILESWFEIVEQRLGTPAEQPIASPPRRSRREYASRK